jgi:hypothetical protein
MNRDLHKNAETGYIDEVRKAQSAGERDEMLQQFPWPKTSTHHLDYVWLDEMTVKLMMVPNPDAASKATISASADLAKLSEPELQEKAAQAGIDPKGKKKGQLVNALVEKAAK